MPRTFSVEPAKSGRAGCKCCGDKIAKGALRMGVHSEGPDGHDYTKWYHLIGCFNQKIKRGPKGRDDIDGIDKLSAAQQSQVMKHVFGDGDDSSSSSDDDDVPINKLSASRKTRKVKSKKRKLESDSDSDDEPPRKRQKVKILSMDEIESMKVAELKKECKERGLKQSGKKQELQERIREHIEFQEKMAKESPESKRKRKKEEKEHKALCEELRGMTNYRLKDMLKHNGMVQSGNKDDLVKRVADCKMYGSYPRCPKCGGGILRVRYVVHQFGHNGQGSWYCPGYMEDDEFVRCSFRSMEPIERPKLRDLFLFHFLCEYILI